MQLEVTPSARDHLVRARTERKVDDRAKPRFSDRNGHVGLSFALAPSSEDVIVDANGTELFVARDLADRLTGGKIDTRQRSEGEVLVFLRRVKSLPA
jgi:hypothetical protein